ncbi:MAG TPA: hypothetical protein ENN07_06755 [candidate division Zixibacteria bacterium]|nr:hypothetical protein [candidate division Zixibacteria bacterium]
MSRNSNYLLITDIGSTTTKGLLLERTDDGFRFLRQFDTATTVEKPDEDVRVGLRRLIEGIGEGLDAPLTDDNGKLTAPFLTTSSAGGGLQILVFGLSSNETGTVAEMTAYGAGGIILKTFTIDDKIPPVEKMRIMSELHPDMILMAGGIDGGAIAPVVELAEILSLAKPSPKFREGEKIPLVFCGNKSARAFVANLLAENFDVHIVPNVRPDMERMNTEPAKAKIHELFMDNVMERAPGYSELKSSVKTDIMPTPAGVEAMLSAFADKTGRNIAMVDIGGATTDIFTVIKSQHHRTVSANIGMSYSLSNILVEAGIEAVSSHIEGIPEGEIRNYIANKTLNPTHVPQAESQKLVEYACAIEGMRMAWEKHVDMNFKISRVGFLDRRKKLLADSNRWEEVLQLNKHEEKFQLSDISLLIGAGGVITHLPGDVARIILADAFMPTGITELAIDRHFKSPHLGIFSKVEPDEALRLFEDECIESLGHVVAPLGKVRRGKPALTVKNRTTGEKLIVEGGQAIIIDGGGDFMIECHGRLNLENDRTTAEINTEMSVIIDCRGRGRFFLGGRISKFKCDAGVVDTIMVEEKKPEFGEYSIDRKLPYDGDILAKVGDSVEPWDTIGENRFGPPRLYILDINRLAGYEKPLSEEDIAEGILVAEGESVKIGQRIFAATEGIFGSKIYFSSPVRGMIEKIEPSGLIIMREIQDYDGRPHTVHVAKLMHIKPSHVAGHLRYRLGDFVEAGQMIAGDLRNNIIIKAPSTGTIKNIDQKSGKVTIQYDIEPVELKAFVRGVVTAVEPKRSVTILATAGKIYGKIGFGGEAAGEILIAENISSLKPELEGKIIASMKPIDLDFLRRCAEIAVAGIIAPSIPSVDWRKFCGRELGLAHTGDEALPFPVIFTSGFGEYEVSGQVRGVIESSAGRLASISGRTQIRAGVIRPAVLIYKE